MSHHPTNNNASATQTETVEETDGPRKPESLDNTPTLQLRLEQRNDRRVAFHDGVIDNEHMNRMKSKCCCIYKKPLEFGESSSEDEEECEHCFGHPEKRKKNKKPANADPTPLSNQLDQPSTSTEALAERAKAPPPSSSDKDSAPDFEATVKPSL